MINFDEWYIYRLDDPLDKWIAKDKIEHFIGGALAFLLFWWLLEPMWAMFVSTFLVGLLVELVESTRYILWIERGQEQPWPFFTDKVSIKDLVVDMMGAVTMWLVLGNLV